MPLIASIASGALKSFGYARRLVTSAASIFPRTYDTYFKYVSLLLRGDAISPLDTGNSTALAVSIDRSADNLLVKSTPGMSASAFHPFIPDGYSSVITNSSAAYYVIPSANVVSSGSFAFGTGNFTIEAWAYPHNIGNAFPIFVLWDGGGSTARFALTLSSDGASLDTASGLALSFTLVAAQTITVGNWYHLAVTREGSSFKLWTNGVLTRTATSSATFVPTAYQGTIGDYSSDFGTTYGTISNLRVTKGTALYTSAFTPSTEPLTATAQTTLLTCQNTRMIDQGVNALPINVVGSIRVVNSHPFAELVPDLSKLGSAYYNGAAQTIIETGLSAGTVFGAGDFTIELWVFPTATPTTSWNAFVSIGSATAGQEIRISQNINNAGYGILFPNNANSDSTYYGYGTLQINQWHHLALVRSGTNLTFYRNGIVVATYTGITFTFTNTGTTQLGYAKYPSDGYYSGHVSNLRIVKGTAVYTAAFTPPTTSLSVTENTKLLTFQYSGSNTSNGIIDSSKRSHQIVRVGNTTLGTYAPYGGSWSTYFNNASYLSIAANYTLPTATTPFTMEGWVYLTAYTGIAIASSPYPSGGAIPFVLGLCNGTSPGVSGSSVGDKLSLNYYNGSSWVAGAVSSVAVPLHTWTYVAGVFTGSAAQVYINGTKTGELAIAAWQVGGNAGLYVGRRWDSAEFVYLSGYVSHFAFTRGSAIVNQPFYEPKTLDTTATLLVAASNTGEDVSLNKNVVTTGGNPRITRFTPFEQSTKNTVAMSSGYNILFNGTSNYLTYPTGTSMAFGTNNFTIETWVYMTANPSIGTTIFGQGAKAGGISLGITSAGKPYASFGYVSGKVNEGGTLALTAPSGFVFTSVLYTAYGVNNGTDPDYVRGTTNITQAQAEPYYIGLTATSIPATNAAWTDPISGTAKTLAGVGTYGLLSSTAITLNAWNHIAVVRKGTGTNETTLYLNGSPVSSGTLTTSFSTSTTNYIGSNVQAGTPVLYFPGKIASLRIENNSAKYTAAFTVPFSQLTSSSTTTLLVGTTSTIVDSSSLNNTLTATGTPVISSGGPFLDSLSNLNYDVVFTPATTGTSMYFDGSDYLMIPDHPALQMQGKTWTVECWVNPTGNYANYNSIWSKRSGSTTSMQGFLAITSGYIGFFNGTQYNSTTTLKAGAWSHCAWVYNGTQITIYVNGKQVLAPTAVTVTNQIVNFYLGTVWTGSAGSEYLIGYLSDFRFNTGTGYTGEFLPPNAPLAATANTVLKIDGKNFTMYDSVGDNNYENYNEAGVSGAVTKFGGGSLYFDGASDYLVYPGNYSLNFGLSAFTIEAWVYLKALPTSDAWPTNFSSHMVVVGTGTASQGDGIDFIIGQTKLMIQSADIQYASTSVHGMSINTWYHIAVTRSGNTLAFFVNGNSIGTVAYSLSVSTGTNTYVGCETGEGAWFNGYMDDLRVTKGIARYTTAFTPPTTYLGDSAPALYAAEAVLPFWTSTKNITMIEGVSYSSQVTAISSASVAISYVSGTLPGGITFDDPTDTFTGTLSAHSTNTSYDITLSASDGTNPTKQSVFTINAKTDVVTWSVSFPGTTTYSTGSSLTINLAATALNQLSTITYSADSLPAGLSISGSTITGTPTTVQTVTSTITATSSLTGRTATTTISWAIIAPVTGQVAYTSPGTFSWVAPTGVYKVSVVCIGAGGGGSAYSSYARGGGGGACIWINNYPVTPGNSYTVVVGTGGGPGGYTTTSTGGTGGDSWFVDRVDVVGAYGGGGGVRTTTANSGMGYGGGGSYGDDPAIGWNGGGAAGGQGGMGYAYGGGGGGAGGYTGNGGSAYFASSTTYYGAGSAGAGGGGGGGAAGGSTKTGGGGGGTGIYGQGTSGAGGGTSSSTTNGPGGAGGSYANGTGVGGANGGATPANTATGAASNTTTPNQYASGGFPGGGGAGTDYTTSPYRNGYGANGAVRIIWGPNRAFPATNTGNL